MQSCMYLKDTKTQLKGHKLDGNDNTVMKSLNKSIFIMEETKSKNTGQLHNHCDITNMLLCRDDASNIITMFVCVLI